MHFGEWHVRVAKLEMQEAVIGLTQYHRVGNHFLGRQTKSGLISCVGSVELGV